MTDRRPTAEDQRLTDVDTTEATARDDSKRVGRATLDEFDWDEATPRRDVLGEAMAHGSTPIPKSKRGRARRRNNPDVEAQNADYPEFPTHIGDWRFQVDYTDNDFLRWGYVDSTQTVYAGLLERKPRVVVYDRREFDGGINAHVVTKRVIRKPAGSPAGAPIVSAPDPVTFRKRLVTYLDGEQPGELEHPFYRPALERNLPPRWEYDGMVPTSTKAKHFWSWDRPKDSPSSKGWRIVADGYVNGAYDVYAYPPGSTTGSRAPRFHAPKWGVDVMPGDGAAVAAETARRIMRAINDDPTVPE